MAGKRINLFKKRSKKRGKAAAATKKAATAGKWKMTGRKKADAQRVGNLVVSTPGKQQAVAPAGRPGGNVPAPPPKKKP